MNTFRGHYITLFCTLKTPKGNVTDIKELEYIIIQVM